MSSDDLGRLRFYRATDHQFLIEHGNAAATAERLKKHLGAEARQFVVDRIMDSIRHSDMEAAHAWEEIGELIDDNR